MVAVVYKYHILTTSFNQRHVLVASNSISPFLLGGKNICKVKKVQILFIVVMHLAIQICKSVNLYCNTETSSVTLIIKN